MGIHAGVLGFADTPISPEMTQAVVRMLTTTLDGSVSIHERPGLVMASLQRNAIGELLSEDQLTSSDTHGDVLAWDGRLDNREDLILRLRPDGPPSSISDSTLILAAYRRWGTDAFGMLIGDWSAGLWDERARSLYLACDYMSVRPLHYDINAQSIMWSSVLGPLAILRGRRGDISTEYVVRLLLSDLPPHLTPYVGIRAVPASHCVTIRADGFTSIAPHWSPGRSTVRYGCPAMYEDALRTVFVEAVRCRLKAAVPVWAELSGGIDSSSIVCVANALASNGLVDAPAIKLISEVSDDPLGGDERHYIRAIEEVACPAQYISSQDYVDATLPAGNWACPKDPFGPRVAGLLTVAANGGTTLMSGRVGDTVMWNTHDCHEVLLEHWQHASPLAFWHDIRRSSFVTGQPLLGLMATLAYRLARAIRGSQATIIEQARRVAQVSLLRDDLITTQAMTAQPHWSASRQHVPIPKRFLFDSVAQYSTFRMLQSPSDFPTVRYTYPYAHRPLLELVLSLPALEQWRPGEPRALMRRAFADFVPSVVLNRRAKGYYAPVALRALKSLVRDWITRIDRLEIVRRGWVDSTKLHNALVAADGGIGRQYWALRWAIRLEMWLGAVSANTTPLLDTRTKGGETHVRQAAVGAGWNSTEPGAGGHRP